jgi:hypothetical protein
MYWISNQEAIEISILTSYGKKKLNSDLAVKYGSNSIIKDRRL